MAEEQSKAKPVTSCRDILEFAEKIRSMRTIDDKIVYEINTTIPTHSFAKGVNVTERCQKLYAQLKQAHDSRQQIIRQCIEQSQRQIEQLLKKRRDNEDDFMKQLRQEQSKLKNFQTELNIEEVIQEQTYKVFKEKCRDRYHR
uniref:Protein MIX23 n=1 Tax=Trichuris muris TaxID=70415 RepID=A0A5S6QC90_TRIMR